MTRSLPNIALTGVPGTGKSTLARHLAHRLNSELPRSSSTERSAPATFKVLDLGIEAARLHCRDRYDETLQSWTIDEDKLAKSMRDDVKKGGFVLDWMHADFWGDEDEQRRGDYDDCPLDLVVTMRANNTVLFDRYKERGYPDRKVQENLDAEIMDSIGDENREALGDGMGMTLVELRGDKSEELEQNVERITQWVRDWKRDNGANGVMSRDAKK